jgi:hypothetical protein
MTKMGEKELFTTSSILQFETIFKFAKSPASLWLGTLEHSDLELVSDFNIRISELYPPSRIWITAKPG